MKQLFAWTQPEQAEPGQYVQYVQVFSTGDNHTELRVRDRHGTEVTLRFPKVKFSHMLGDMVEARL